MEKHQFYYCFLESFFLKTIITKLFKVLMTKQEVDLYLKGEADQETENKFNNLFVF